MNEVVPIAQLESLPYLRAVVKEALRHGVGTSSRLSRIAPDESFDVQDKKTGMMYHIPAGSVVSMSPYCTIMDEDVFVDPLGFHPERWLDEDERLDKYLIMFGGGTRVCLGMALAQAELFLMLAKFFRRWGSAGVEGGDPQGDVREGDVGVLKIFETTPRDCQMASDYFIPLPYKVCFVSCIRLGLTDACYRAVRVFASSSSLSSFLFCVDMPDCMQRRCCLCIYSTFFNGVPFEHSSFNATRKQLSFNCSRGLMYPSAVQRALQPKVSLMSQWPDVCT